MESMITDSRFFSTRSGRVPSRSETWTNNWLKCLRRCGTLVCVDFVREMPPVSPFEMLNWGIKVVGSSVGTLEHLEGLWEMAVETKVRPIVEVREFEGLVVVRIP